MKGQMNEQVFLNGLKMAHLLNINIFPNHFYILIIYAYISKFRTMS
jgi:hypothetical protein